MRLLLHACCGPCSLEPTRLLRAAGHDLTILYANSNIAPAEEYAHRLATLRAWAEDERLPVVEGAYDPERWEAGPGRIGETQGDPVRRRGTVPRLLPPALGRGGHVCPRRPASTGVGTTLSVSPYQYTDVIRDELERAAAQAGVAAVFEDFRPFYDQATRRSRALGMYRQNYCGCRFSDAEAARSVPSERPPAPPPAPQTQPHVPKNAQPPKPRRRPGAPNAKPTPKSKPRSAPC